MKLRSVAVTLLFGYLLGSPSIEAQITGGMLNPDMDAPGEPFSYFWHPTDAIGTLFAPVASEVTPEGYIYTGFGELMFFLDNPPVPVDKRVKTLCKGYLPVVQYQLARNQITYTFSLFAANLGGEIARGGIQLAPELALRRTTPGGSDAGDVHF
ncbi:MAG: hypothetical protein N2689_13130, partial [Verrucomicrobiae bacterium]|nr:hypothetical protein [Verrucomicrobiae bacterium]